MTKQILGLLFFNAALLFMITAAFLAAHKGEPLSDVVGGILRVICAALNRVKLLAVGVVSAAVGLYDIITQGGIDLTGVLKPLIGDHIDVGRLLATTALVITLARFVMQTGLFKSSNKNGLDNPDEPDISSK